MIKRINIILNCVFLYCCSIVYAADNNIKLQPLLLYNQFPRSWNMDICKMKEYLPTIKYLGFNAVWINPFMKTSKNFYVSRKNDIDGQYVKAVGSLYAMFDPSLIYVDEYRDTSDGNPSQFTESSKDIVSSYVNEAKYHGLDVLFDLVLHHVSKDSPLVAGTFTHFIDKRIDTSKWFKGLDENKWDDVRAFDYSGLDNRKEILEHLWKPFIDKMLKVYGFSGARIDFATGPKMDHDIVKDCVQYIKMINPNAIIFAEDLYPFGGYKRIKNVVNISKDVGFNNLTNISMYIKLNCYYEPFKSDIGLKRLTAHKHSKYFHGTIGFAGSHDYGPMMLAYNKTYSCKVQDSEKIRIAKQQLSVAAFTSDAGWYLLSGDELLSCNDKSVFAQQNMTNIYNTDSFTDKIDESVRVIQSFIKSINDTFQKLRCGDNLFWFDILADNNILYFIRYINNNDCITYCDIIAVNISEQTVDCICGNDKNEVIQFIKSRDCRFLSSISNEDINVFFIT